MADYTISVGIEGDASDLTQAAQDGKKHIKQMDDGFAIRETRCYAQRDQHGNCEKFHGACQLGRAHALHQGTARRGQVNLAAATYHTAIRDWE